MNCARVLLLGIALVGLAASQSLAQTKPPAPSPKPAAATPVSSEPETTTASYGVWTLRCTHRQEGDTHICEVDQGVVPQGQQNPIAQIGIGRPTPKEDLRITVILPTNITFQNAPKAIAEDKDPGVELTWRRCLPGGCIADAVLKEDTLRVWRAVAADTGRLFFTDAAGRNVAVQFSLRGFGQAMEALSKEH